MVSLQTLDAVLLILLIGFVAWGFSNGFIQAVGGLIGIIVSGALASRFYLGPAGWIQSWFGLSASLAAIISFTLLFLIIGRLFGLLVWVVQKAFNIISFIPFLKSINRILGVIFGFALGLVFIGTILFVAGKYSPYQSFNDAVAKSSVAQFIIASSKVVQVFFPQDLLGLKSYF